MKTSTAAIGLLSLAASSSVTLATSSKTLRGNNLVVQYWGQNSAGASGGPYQKDLNAYCDDDSVDILALSFLTSFGIGDLDLNFANICGGPVGNPNAVPCTQLAKDITYCQNKGKQIILSMGGAAGLYGFESDEQARETAQTLWKIFGPNQNLSDTPRPFGDAAVDGFDLDIEGGKLTGYAAFVEEMRSINSDIIISAAPQCPFPNGYFDGDLLKVEFDYVLIQFYNNYCNIGTSSFNFDQWVNWAKSFAKSRALADGPTPRLFIGTPGAASAAGTGYVGFDGLDKVLQKLKQEESSLGGFFGGVSMWDASQSFTNVEKGVNFAQYAKNLLNQYNIGGGSVISTSTYLPTYSETSIFTNSSSIIPTSSEPTFATSSSEPTSEPTTVPTSDVTSESTTLPQPTTSETYTSEPETTTDYIPSTTKATRTNTRTSLGPRPTKCVPPTDRCVHGSKRCGENGYQIDACVGHNWVCILCPLGTVCKKLFGHPICLWPDSVVPS